ncbi:hypothetical protein F3Y22_tig00110190pilonHSYRG00007 [Hibiscus syriacus]|uniref:Uncharacterized protein n=1 Tax=Hibiscus syriacus TaxID=106335 RepID=A0A6A3BDR7_HIBSY|nr:hypothetical protein F3Y22_tig00110190pilonHSYRG00007 [Hibiscus syriacus]
MLDDASSSSSSTSTNSNGPLYELSELMAQLQSREVFQRFPGKISVVYACPALETYNNLPRKNGITRGKSSIWGWL